MEVDNLRDPMVCMNQDGPMDPHFQIPGGTLLYNPYHDAWFPYLYALPIHVLVHSPEYIKKILVHVVDTSMEDHIAHAEFTKRLSIPFGSNALMEKYGKLHWFDLICHVIILWLTILSRINWTRTWHNHICSTIMWSWHISGGEWHRGELVSWWVCQHNLFLVDNF